MELLAHITGTAGSWATLSRDARTLGYPVSLFLGFWLLRAYCASNRIPLPAPDSSLLVCVALLALSCYFVMLFLLGGPIFAFAVTATAPEVKALRPLDAASKPSLDDAIRFAKQWSMTFLPFLLSSCSASLTWVITPLLYPNLTTNPTIVWQLDFNTVVLLIAGALFLAALPLSAIYYMKSFGNVLSSTLLSRYKFLNAIFTVTFASFLACSWTFAATVTVVFFALGSQFLQYNSSTLHFLGIFFPLLFWFPTTILFALWRRFREIVIPGITICIISVVLFGPRLGGLSLRVLGYGGGIPVCLVARVVAPQAHKAALESIGGCLVLWTGTQITVLRPLRNALQISRCHFNPLTPNIVDGQPIATSLDTINRSDVLDVFSIGQRPNTDKPVAANSPASTGRRLMRGNAAEGANEGCPI